MKTKIILFILSIITISASAQNLTSTNHQELSKLTSNTNKKVPGLRGLHLYEGDPDYELKKAYQESGITWGNLMQVDPENATKWASEHISNSKFRIPNKPVTEEEMVNFFKYADSPMVDSFSGKTLNQVSYEAQQWADEAVVDRMNRAQQIMDESGYGNSKYDTEQQVSLAELEAGDLQDIRDANQKSDTKKILISLSIIVFLLLVIIIMSIHDHK